MKLRTKLMVSPVLAGAMLVGAIASSLWVLGAFKERSAVSHGAVLQAYSRVADERAQLGELHARLYRTITIIGSMDDAAVTAMRQRQAKALDEMLAGVGRRQAEAAGDEPLRSALVRYGGELHKYRKAADDAIDLSTVDANTGAAALQTADSDFAAMSRTLGDVIERVRARGAAEVAVLDVSARRASLLIAALGAVALALSIGIAWATQRRVAAQLAAASRAAERVAQGRLDEQPRSDANDEVGDLVRTLGTMVERLRHSIHSVRSAAESIGVASNEIAQGNADLSVRTEQAASNLQETASSMEQITGTVKQSADSALTANQLAGSAREVAQRGGNVVSEVVSTMAEINASSRRIAEIVGVIDGLAFQTNLLALNAAVEAARAGAQGRGFAVVAGEVRTLAQRSAQAAREIKMLIDTSVERVETGARLVGEAGATMNEIVVSVQRVTEVIGEITAAAAEQSCGIGQVNVAVAHLDEMTQQNAALAEESTAAAESLRQQAVVLTAAVAAFRLEAA